MTAFSSLMRRKGSDDEMRQEDGLHQRSKPRRSRREIFMGNVRIQSHRVHGDLMVM